MTPPRLLIVAGLPRTGTTYLYHNLAKHPAFFAPFRKELNYFLTNHGRGPKWLHGLYKGMGPDQWGLDVSPSYFVDLASIERIKAHGNRTKVLFCVRHPVDFALSWYKQQLTHFRSFMPFGEFLESWTARRGDGHVTISLSGGHLRRSIEAFRQGFGKDMLLYNFQEFTRDRLHILAAVERFMGVEPLDPAAYDDVRINAADRRHLRPLNYLLSREWFISLVEHTVPHGLIRGVRDAMDRHSRPARQAAKPQTHEEEADWKRLAQEVLAEDVRHYERLFRHHAVQLGDGSQFTTCI